MRLIDADEIPYTDLSEGHGVCWVTFMDWIKKMPTVDAVEVVRCKDCRYGQVHNIKGTRICEEHYDAPMMDNDYCSYGEREEA